MFRQTVSRSGLLLSFISLLPLLPLLPFLNFLTFLTSLFICASYPEVVFANQMQQQFDQTGSQYQHHSKQMIQSGILNNQIKPQDYTKDDVNNVPEKAYRDNPKAIDADKQPTFNHNPQANAIRTANNKNKHRINPNNPAYQKAVGYQDNAEQILRDNGQDMQCVEVAGQSTTQTTTQHCRVSNHQYLECFKYPQVNIIDVTIPARDIHFSGT
uniref:hypothetical protein n=1 Tax=Cysteiniphilum litorale TaxID=2056700 RepID=UPI003F881F65